MFSGVRASSSSSSSIYVVSCVCVCVFMSVMYAAEEAGSEPVTAAQLVEHPELPSCQFDV